MAELRDLNLISAFQYEQLQAYIQNFGPMLSVFELSSVDGFDQQTIDLLSPIITVGNGTKAEKIKLKNVLTRGRHQVLMRMEQVLEEKEGYKAIGDSNWEAKPNSHYLGSPQKLYARYSFNYRNKVRAGRFLFCTCLSG